jgi:uncharacterized membrane protein
MEYLILPLMVSLIGINGIFSYCIIARERKREKVTTYAKNIYLSIWAVCGLSILIAAFLFPLTRVYSYDLVPMLTSLVLGIAVFTTGVIFDEKRVQWCGSLWWIGSIFLAYTPPGMLRMYIFSALILLGWVLPGLIMNRRYRNREKANGS